MTEEMKNELFVLFMAVQTYGGVRVLTEEMCTELVNEVIKIIEK